MKKSTGNLIWHFFLPLLNTSSGILLKILRPFHKGDFIEIDGEIGSVIKQNLQFTNLAGINGETISIRNSKFYSHSLHNLSTKNIIRMDLNLRVGFTDNMTNLKETIFSFLQNQSGILNNPKAKISLVKLHDNDMELRIAPWCLLDNYIELENRIGITLEQHLLTMGFNITIEEEAFNELREIA